MIRISEIKHPCGTVLKLDGHLKAADTAELMQACQLAPCAKVLDLSDLQSANGAGLATLRELISRGIQIRHASPYIELLLKTKPE